MSVYSKNNLIERQTFGEQIDGYTTGIPTSREARVQTPAWDADDMLRNYTSEEADFADSKRIIFNEALEVLFSGACSLTGVNGKMELRNNPQCFQAICSVTNSKNCFTNFDDNYSIIGNADGFIGSTATGGSDLIGSQTFTNLNPIGCMLKNDIFDSHGVFTGGNRMELSNFDQCSFSVCAVTESNECWENFF